MNLSAEKNITITIVNLSDFSRWAEVGYFTSDRPTKVAKHKVYREGLQCKQFIIARNALSTV